MGKGSGILVTVRVQPRASRNALVVEPDGRIRVALTAPPVEGAANEALRVFLAEVFGVPRASVRVVRGDKSRDKVVSVAGITEQRVKAILQEATRE
ncbi:MAG: DUF167 domain-containing protein [FCB group bacterium]|jgi:uncharacterized protein (TIGR00251 family)|nr:DUF167 domain-containing protein [FCB group bacterium]